MEGGREREEGGREEARRGKEMKGGIERKGEKEREDFLNKVF